jgi:hypothetical protein
MGKTGVCFIISFLAFSSKALSQLHFKQNIDSAALVPKIRVLPQNFYIQHLGFFCKKEDQFQKRTGLNLFIRLGDKRQVDYLEGKNLKR